MINHRFLTRLILLILLIVLTLAALGLLVLLESKKLAYFHNDSHLSVADIESTVPFPISVDPITETIEYRESNSLAPDGRLVDSGEETWWQQIFAFLVPQDWYQNLASPVSRIVVIWPGERKEEAAQNIGTILRWDTEEKERFISLVTTREPVLPEGTFYPDRYVVHRYASPEEMANLVSSRFDEEVGVRYTEEVAARVPLEDALIVASLLEREASDFTNMREVAGVIWNRLFIDMPLQLDATLQYVRGSRPSEPEWWPVPRPSDKFLQSPYNTYQEQGLPPAPIANPSSDAVLAALNPIPTDCLFYFHGPDGAYYCSQTYEEHVAKLKTAY